MDWSLPKIIAGFVATGVLLLVYAQLFALHRRKFLALWTAAWLCYAARNLLSVWLPSDFGRESPVVWSYSLLAGAGAYLLLWGNRLFLDKRAKAPLWPIVAILAGFFWVLPGQLLGLPRIALITPACIAVGLTYAAAGLCLIRVNSPASWPGFAAGVALVYWGVVQQILVTALTTPTPENLAWGLLNGSACEVLTAIFLLVAFYQQINQELLQSQRNLMGQQKRLETALGNLPLAVYAFDSDGKPGLWNSAAKALTGYQAGELGSLQRAIELIFDTQDQRVLTLDSHNLANGVPLTLERKNGDERDVLLHSMSASAPLEGWPSWGAVLDVTRQKLAEKQLRRQLDFNNAVLGSATALTVVLDAQGRIALFNNACERVTGHSMDEVIGLYAWDTLTPPEERQRVKQYFTDLNAEQFPNQGLYQWVKADGHRIKIQWSTNAIRDDQGKVEYVVASGVDVTEQLRAQANLKRSEQFHRGILENMPGGMLIFDYPQREIIYANPAAYGMLDLTGAQPPLAIKLQDWADTRMGKLAPIIEDLGPGQTIRVQDVALLNRGGKPIHCDVSASVVEIEGRHQTICFLRDTSQRDAARERIRQVTASVTHNFNNLLMAITGNVQALGDLMQDRRATRREMKLMDNVAKAASNGQDMVRRLEAFLVAGIQDTDRHEVLSIAEVVHTALDLVETGLMQYHSRRLETDLQQNLWVRGQRSELVEVLLNLLNNAMDASGKNGKIKIHCVLEGGMVRLSVSDNGPGIDPKHQSRLFEPFFSTKGVRGKGLGLASCKGVIEAHGGAIKAQSPEKGGAVFSIILPFVESLQQLQAKAQPQKGGRPRSVLLVEDEALVAMGAEAVLVKAGHHVRHAANVAQARVALRQAWPDVVICDQGLPDGSAWDVARAMAANHNHSQTHTPFVVVTGWNLDSQSMTPPPDIPKPDLIIRKPVERGELLRAAEID